MHRYCHRSGSLSINYVTQLSALYTQFPICFFPCSLEPITFRLLPWHSTNMVLTNNINEVHALHLTCPFSSIWHHSLCSFLSHSFHLMPRTPYFLGFPSPHWLLPHSVLLLVSDFLPPLEHLKAWFLDFSSVFPLEISSNPMFSISSLSWWFLHF